MYGVRKSLIEGCLGVVLRFPSIGPGQRLSEGSCNMTQSLVTSSREAGPLDPYSLIATLMQPPVIVLQRRMSTSEAARIFGLA